MKRLMDVLVSLSALVLLCPIFLVTAFAIVAESGFPVFFCQPRVGLGGRTFKIFKFRSMRQETASSGSYFTKANDARITSVGRVIRRTSIDELPQIMNVLLGDMSLVGPRPDVPVQQALYRPEDWELRCSVLPGITGLAQVSGRSEITFEQRLAFDLQYVREVSWWRDLQIMWMTLSHLGGKQSN